MILHQQFTFEKVSAFEMYLLFEIMVYGFNDYNTLSMEA